MVTDNATLNIMNNKFDRPVVQRPIPSNIRVSDEIDKDENSFCYFGLINKSKSFKEMIDAWKEFNINKQYKLNIYTSSKLDTKDFDKYGINYFYNLCDEDLSKELWKNKFAILPIKPNVASNNASFKAVLQHKCIPIGIFNKFIECRENYIEINDNIYTKENIKLALNKSANLSQNEYIKKIENIKDDVNIFTFDESLDRKIIPFLKSIS